VINNSPREQQVLYTAGPSIAESTGGMEESRCARTPSRARLGSRIIERVTCTAPAEALLRPRVTSTAEPQSTTPTRTRGKSSDRSTETGHLLSRSRYAARAYTLSS
jgi:hypothetical protein